MTGNIHVVNRDFIEKYHLLRYAHLRDRKGYDFVIFGEGHSDFRTLVNGHVRNAQIISLGGLSRPFFPKGPYTLGRELGAQLIPEYKDPTEKEAEFLESVIGQPLTLRDSSRQES